MRTKKPTKDLPLECSHQLFSPLAYSSTFGFRLIIPNFCSLWDGVFSGQLSIDAKVVTIFQSLNLVLYGRRSKFYPGVEGEFLWERDHLGVCVLCDPGGEGEFVWERSCLGARLPPALPAVQGVEDHLHEVSFIPHQPTTQLNWLFLYTYYLVRLKFIDSHTVEKEEEIYCTKISYIEPIFEGGLQVVLIWFLLFPFSKVAVQLYLIYMMATKVDILQLIYLLVVKLFVGIIAN